MSTTDVVIANTSFSAGTRAVVKGETFRASHPVVEGREELFDPFVIDNDFEQATAAPGEKRRGGPKRTKKASEKTEEKQATAAPGETAAAEDGDQAAEGNSAEAEATADSAEPKEAGKSSADKE